MYNDRLAYLKRLLKRTYKRYIGERKDEDATLMDVCKFFNISIEAENEQNYQVVDIDYVNNPSIILVDNKNNVTYKAEYTAWADLFNYYGSDIRFINLIIESPIKKVESLFYVGEEKPLITKMIFSNNGYSLAFEKERPNDISGTSNKKITVKYFIDNYRDSGVSENLLTKTFQTHNGDESVYTFEQTFNDNSMAYSLMVDYNNRYSYVEKGDITYGVLNSRSETLHTSVSGLCFENTKINRISEYFPYNMSYSEYPKINDQKTVSAIIFNGYNNKEKCSKRLEIYKTIDSVIGRYKVIDYSNRPEKVLSEEDILLPILEAGKITSKEVKSLFDNLQSNFNDSFISFLEPDLLEFAKRIDIKNGVIKEDLDPLSPKLLFDRSFEEIASMIDSDKNKYFELAKEQFCAIANVEQEKVQTKILKHKNS